jgi:hypothetical protein
MKARSAYSPERQAIWESTCPTNGYRMALQSRNELVLKSRLGIERVARVKHREQILDYISVLLPSNVRKRLHGYVVLGALEPTNDVLSHLGLILTIAERTRILEGLNRSRLKCTGPTTP